MNEVDGAELDAPHEGVAQCGIEVHDVCGRLDTLLRTITMNASSAAGVSGSARSRDVLHISPTESKENTEDRGAMLTSDDFVIIVPIEGLPRLAAPGEDLSPYVGMPFSRANKTVALKDGRTVQGSVFWARAKSAGDELQILELLNAQFVPTIPG